MVHTKPTDVAFRLALPLGVSPQLGLREPIPDPLGVLYNAREIVLASAEYAQSCLASPSIAPIVAATLEALREAGRQRAGELDLSLPGVSDPELTSDDRDLINRIVSDGLPAMASRVGLDRLLALLHKPAAIDELEIQITLSDNPLWEKIESPKYWIEQLFERVSVDDPGRPTSSETAPTTKPEAVLTVSPETAPAATPASRSTGAPAGPSSRLQPYWTTAAAVLIAVVVATAATAGAAVALTSSYRAEIARLEQDLRHAGQAKAVPTTAEEAFRQEFPLATQLALDLPQDRRGIVRLIPSPYCRPPYVVAVRAASELDAPDADPRLFDANDPEAPFAPSWELDWSKHLPAKGERDVSLTIQFDLTAEGKELGQLPNYYVEQVFKLRLTPAGIQRIDDQSRGPSVTCEVLAPATTEPLPASIPIHFRLRRSQAPGGVHATVVHTLVRFVDGDPSYQTKWFVLPLTVNPLRLAASSEDFEDIRGWVSLRQVLYQLDQEARSQDGRAAAPSPPGAPVARETRLEKVKPTKAEIAVVELPAQLTTLWLPVERLDPSNPDHQAAWIHRETVPLRPDAFAEK